MNTLVKRQNIMALEDSIKGLDGFVEGDGPCKITHYFAPGVYLREMWMPKDCVVVGKIHKTEHICILSKGVVTVANGEDKETYVAPATIHSKIGAKRALYAHEESVWTNIHPTHLTDPQLIEKEIIAESFDEIDALLANEDYKKFLLEFGVDESAVREISDQPIYDVADLSNVEIKPSKIEGFGVFPRRPFKASEVIGSAMVDGKKTAIGKYTNHAPSPNARMRVKDKDNIELVAVCDIGDEEITTDYRETALSVQAFKDD